MAADQNVSLKRKFFYSLRAQILACFLTVSFFSIVPVSYIYIFGIPSSRFSGIMEETERKSFAQLNLIADLKKEQLKQWFDERRVDIKLFSKNQLVHTLLEKLSRESPSAPPSLSPEQRQLKAILVEMQNSYRDIEEIELFERETGRIFASVNSGKRATGPVAIENGLFPPGYEEHISLRLENGKLYLQIHRLLEGTDLPGGRGVPSVIGVKINADDIIRPMLLAGKGLGKTGEVLLVTQDRRIVTSLAHPLADGSRASLLTFQISADPARFAAEGQEGTIISKDYRDAPVLAAYRHIQITTELAFGMVVKIDKEEVYEELRNNLVGLLVMISSACLLFALLSFFLSRRLSLTVAEMVHVADKVESGELGVRVRRKKNDEIGALAISFNRMIERLELWNEDLEQQVGERTVELQEATKQLRLNQIILNKSQEIARQGSWHLDILQNRLTWSAEAYRIFGKTPQEFGATYEAFLEAVHPADRDLVDKTYTNAIQKKIPYECVHRIIRDDGEIRVVLEKSEDIVDETGQPIHSYGFTQDITDQQRIEREKRDLELRLAQAQKMEAIGTLAGGIAHDFNNILGVILGYTELAMDDIPPDSKPAGDLNQVLEAANRAKDLVKQILAFSRQTKIERIPIQLQSLIKETLKMMRHSIPATIEIQDEIDSRCGVVLADPTQVQQILMNLCTNATHAMAESGGVMRIELNRVYVGGDSRQLNIAPGKYVELVVSDTGCGIGPDVIDKIFDPYFTTKEAGQGTGMGLAIIHGIIAEYGGTVSVESEPGKGAVFQVYFPEVDRKELPTDKDAEEVPRGNGRILFIDDEELLAEMGKHILERLGYSVTVRQSSLEALSTFLNSPDEFDLIITDQTMPGMTGMDLARRMLQIRPDIPIILCTGYSNLVDEDSAKALGIKEFALKPLTTATIAKLVKKVLKR